MRASSALHESRTARSAPRPLFRYLPTPEDRNTIPRPVYFELLREIGRELELRVIVDIIAGASAGGINGSNACAGA